MMTGYKTVQFMQVNGFLDGLPCNYWSVYKLTCNITGHFYIGQTKDLHQRLSQHVSCIIYAAEGLDASNYQQVHRSFGDIFRQHHTDKRKKIGRFVRESLTMFTMSVTGDAETALLVESHYIKKHKDDPLFVNSKQNTIFASKDVK